MKGSEYHLPGGWRRRAGLRARWFNNTCETAVIIPQGVNFGTSGICSLNIFVFLLDHPGSILQISQKFVSLFPLELMLLILHFCLLTLTITVDDLA